MMKKCFNLNNTTVRLFGSVKYFMYAQRMPHILNGLYIVCVKLKVVSSDIPIIIFSIFHRHVALNSFHTQWVEIIIDVELLFSCM